MVAKSAVRKRVAAVDTSVLIGYLTPDEQEDAATALMLGLLSGGTRLVAPEWMWVEVGSVLRRKERRHLLTAAEVEGAWRDFLALPFEPVAGQALAERAWELSRRYDLPTLYDAAWLACVEICGDSGGGTEAEFWTADRVLLRALRFPRPPYVRELAPREESGHGEDAT